MIHLHNKIRVFLIFLILWVLEKMECLAGELKKKELVRLEGWARKTCFERRRKGLQRKASQLDDAPDMHIWPPNVDEVRCTVDSYQQRAFDVKAGNTTGKKRMRFDAANFASLGSKKRPNPTTKN